MHNLFRKELKLSAHILSYLFIFFGFMFFLPGYPVLCGAFFVTLGLFQSFQSVRENNDILFSALLPFAKRDVVRGKFLFVCFIELCAFLLMAAVAVFRQTVLVSAAAYRDNALMNANGFALSAALLIFALFNSIFVGGFFKTAYKFGRPFVTYIIVCFLVILAAEALHYFPGMSAVNAFGADHLGLQIGLVAGGFAVYGILTWIAYRVSCKRFEEIDL